MATRADILLLAHGENAIVTTAVRKLERRGLSVFLSDPADYPACVAISMEQHDNLGPPLFALRDQERVLNLNSILGVWLLTNPTTQVRSSVAAPYRDFAHRTCVETLMEFWDCLSCTFLPGRPSQLVRARQKTRQMKLAVSLGFSVPPTLVSNDPDKLLGFFHEHGGKIVSKVAGTAFQESAMGGVYRRLTERVTKRDLRHIDSIQHCPMIFQSYVDKAVELRVTVVGRTVFAAEIQSQALAETRHDWRRHGTRPRVTTHALPFEVERRCRDVVARLGLSYGAIDLILTPSGEYVFLEVNPAGQYAWIEQATDMPITDALIDLLLAQLEGNRE